MPIDNDAQIIPRALILGSTGRLGSFLVKSNFLGSEYEILAHTRRAASPANADLSDKTATHKMLNILKPSVIINTVALAEIESCEKNPNRAFRTNVLTVENIVDWVLGSKQNCHLVHISTDHLYDGTGSNKEESINLSNYYAYSKYTSEFVARQVPSTVLRTNFVGKSSSDFRQTFSDWFVGCIRNNRAIEVVNDIWFSPVTLDNLSSAISVACKQKPSIIANFGSRGGITKYDFCARVASELNLSMRKVSAVTAEDCDAYQTYRPRNMVMDSSLWESVTGMACPTIDNVIKSVVNEYR